MKKSRPSRRITTPLLSPESPMISPLFTLHPMGSRIVSPFAIAPGRPAGGPAIFALSRSVNIAPYSKRGGTHARRAWLI